MRSWSVRRPPWPEVCCRDTARRKTNFPCFEAYCGNRNRSPSDLRCRSLSSRASRTTRGTIPRTYPFARLWNDSCGSPDFVVRPWNRPAYSNRLGRRRHDSPRDTTTDVASYPTQRAVRDLPEPRRTNLCAYFVYSNEPASSELLDFSLTWRRCSKTFFAAARGAALQRRSGRCHANWQEYLDVDQGVRMRLDPLWRSTDGRALAVIDAKYKAEEPAGFPNADQCQLRRTTRLCDSVRDVSRVCQGQ